MFRTVKTGKGLLLQSVKALRKYPLLIAPLLITWIIYAPIVIWAKFFIEWEAYLWYEQSAILFSIIFSFSILLGVSCLILLELIQQIESGEPLRLSGAARQVFSFDFIRAFPIILVWSLLWFILTIIKIIFTRRSDSTDSEDKANAENAARALIRSDSDWSFSGAFIDMVQKGMRMIVFLILPAIAWENHSTLPAFRKGIAALKAHLKVFIAGFVLTDLAAWIVMFPAALTLYISAKLKIHFSDEVWTIVIIYIAFAWSFTFFIEQMFAAELYLWHLKWEKACSIAVAEGKTLPHLAEVRTPSLLNNVPDLVGLLPKISNEHSARM